MLLSESIKLKIIDMLTREGQKLSPIRLQYNLLMLKKEFKITLPQSYIELLSVADGGDICTLYYPNPRKDLIKTEYFLLSRLHGLTSGHTTIRSEKISQKELLFDNWLSDFVNNFFDFLEINNLSVNEYRKKDIIPRYLIRYEDTSRGVKVGSKVLYPHRIDENILNKLYNDKNYLHRMNSVVGEVAEIDSRTLVGRLRGNYNFLIALINSFEFATFDGHDSICFYYGNEKSNEPSIWYVNMEASKAFEIAENFETFISNLKIER